MILRSRHARRHARSQELNLTTFINLMVVLVSFLLATAVYSHIAVHELNLPSASGGPADGPPPRNLTVTIHATGFIVNDSSSVLLQVPLKDGKFDYETLALFLEQVKARVPNEKSLTLRVEPNISYDVIIQTMDAARSPPGGFEGFPDIAIGDAPLEIK